MKIEAKFYEAAEFEAMEVKVVGKNYTQAELIEIFRAFGGRITSDDFGGKHFISKFCEYGDYDNSCDVERANVRVLEEANCPAGSTGCGNYGYVYYAIELVPDLMNREQWDELIEVFRGLGEYPCIDEQAMYEVMGDAIEEAWSDWIYSEFLGKVADVLCRTQGWYTCDIEHPEDLSDAIRGLFESLCQSAGEYPIMEAGGSIWIDLDKLVKNGGGEITPDNLLAMGLKIEGE